MAYVCFVLALAMQQPAAARPPQMPMLPLTQLDERTPAVDLDNRTFSVTFAQAVPLKEVLLLLVRGTPLSIVPDPAISGSFLGELKNVTVRQALGLILPPFGLDFSVDGTVVRVFKRQPETRIFEVNYIAADRAGVTAIGTAPDAHSSAAINTTVRSDVFGDLARGVQGLLSEHATFNIDRKAGLVQVTDFPERLDRVASYLDAVHDRVRRQVVIDARIVEVELKDEKAPGIDWSALGTRVATLARVMAALESQGTVTVLANPRLVAMNNEPALVRSEVVTLSVTPQIAPDTAIMLDVSPIVTSPALSEADMLARVADGETLVIPGLTRDRDVKERKNVGASGGWFGRGTVVTRTRVETVILLTPRIVAGAETR